MSERRKQITLGRAERLKITELARMFAQAQKEVEPEIGRIAGFTESGHLMEVRLRFSTAGDSKGLPIIIYSIYTDPENKKVEWSNVIPSKAPEDVLTVSFAVVSLLKKDTDPWKIFEELRTRDES